MENNKPVKPSHPIDPESFLMHDLAHIPAGYWHNEAREEYFELIWFNYTHSLSATAAIDQQSYLYLIPMFSTVQVGLSDKAGYIIAFKRIYLEEDDKEYALDIFQLFNRQGQYSTLLLDSEITTRLQRIKLLLGDEYANPQGAYLVLKALLKAYLLNLVRLQQKGFLNQDVNQKRIYQFIMLVNEHFIKERKVSFYAQRMGIGEKRLNQVLLEKMHKTATQQLHNRLIWEAKRMLTNSEFTIKEIAYQLNFEDRGYFTRFFKKQTGQTPEDFKRNRHNA